MLEDVQINTELGADGRIVVHVRGPLDLPEVGDLRATFSEISPYEGPDVVLDMTEVSFLGSSGMGAIAQVRNDLAAHGRHLTLRGASPSIRRAFEMTHLDRIVELEPARQPA